MAHVQQQGIRLCANSVLNRLRD